MTYHRVTAAGNAAQWAAVTVFVAVNLALVPVAGGMSVTLAFTAATVGAHLAAGRMRHPRPCPTCTRPVGGNPVFTLALADARPIRALHPNRSTVLAPTSPILWTAHINITVVMALAVFHGTPETVNPWGVAAALILYVYPALDTLTAATARIHAAADHIRGR